MKKVVTKLSKPDNIVLLSEVKRGPIFIKSIKTGKLEGMLVRCDDSSWEASTGTGGLVGKRPSLESIVEILEMYETRYELLTDIII